jgi:hypothetical protein
MIKLHTLVDYVTRKGDVLVSDLRVIGYTVYSRERGHVETFYHLLPTDGSTPITNVHPDHILILEGP